MGPRPIATSREGLSIQRIPRHIQIAVALIGALAVANLVLWLTSADAAPSAKAQQQTYLGLTAKQWHARAVTRTKERNGLRADVRMLTRHIRKMRSAIVHRPSSLEAIRLASIAYGVSYRTLYNVAACETGGTFSPYADNPSSTASGLFQFLTSTFAGTPYGRESIWSPYANALAAGWMWSHGRGGEWVCRP